MSDLQNHPEPAELLRELEALGCRVTARCPESREVELQFPGPATTAAAWELLRELPARPTVQSLTLRAPEPAGTGGEWRICCTDRAGAKWELILRPDR